MDIKDVHIIIMAGASDFGRCKLASRSPVPLWPVDGRPAIERLLGCLADQGVTRATVCASEDNASLAESFKTDNRVNVSFFTEELPVGTAGCIRDAAGDSHTSLLVVLPANITCPPLIHHLVEAHEAHDAELTVMLNPDSGNENLGARISGIYVLNTAVLALIPEVGYFDIKEGLIPKMIREGKLVHTETLATRAGNFRNWQEYLCATADYFDWKAIHTEGMGPSQHRDVRTAEVAGDAQVDPTARLCGPVKVLDRARIARGAIILGPAVIGKDAVIGEDTAVVGSVIWDHSQVGRNSHIDRCVLESGANVPGHTTLVARAVLRQSDTIPQTVCSKAMQTIAAVADLAKTSQFAALRGIANKACDAGRCAGAIPLTYAAGIAVVLAFLYCCWPNIGELWQTWQRSDEYSSGLLVPFLAVYVLWTKRHEVVTYTRRPSLLWGLLTIAAAQAFRIYGLFYMYRSAEQLSIVLTAVAVVVMLFGWQFSKRIAAILAFLLLMLPWPNRVQATIAQPLQTLATKSAVFMLEMSGYEVQPEGHVINIEGTSVAVAEACNGLRMITAFFVIGGLVILIVKRAWWEKLIVLASCLPIALLCNTIRLTVTSIAFTMLEGEHWEEIFHDFGGYAMMPLALAGIVGELWLLKHLTTAPQNKETVVIERRTGDVAHN